MKPEVGELCVLEVEVGGAQRRYSGVGENAENPLLCEMARNTCP